MDWLRSEDLKEEKVVTASTLTITRRQGIYSFQIDHDSFWDGCVLTTPLMDEPRNSHEIGRIGNALPQNVVSEFGLAGNCHFQAITQFRSCGFQILFKIAHLASLNNLAEICAGAPLLGVKIILDEAC